MILPYLCGALLTPIKWKGKPFVVSRSDVDTTLLPMKYLNELRLLPDTKMSGRLAQVSVSIL